jgi:hypothetical protein
MAIYPCDLPAQTIQLIVKRVTVEKERRSAELHELPLTDLGPSSWRKDRSCPQKKDLTPVVLRIDGSQT